MIDYRNVNVRLCTYAAGTLQYPSVISNTPSVSFPSHSVRQSYVRAFQLRIWQPQKVTMYDGV